MVSGFLYLNRVCEKRRRSPWPGEANAVSAGARASGRLNRGAIGGRFSWPGRKQEKSRRAEETEMRRRLYFMLPDTESARTIERELLLAKVDDPHIHFLAKDGVNLGRLHVANLLQRSDLFHGVGLGVVAGGATGVLAGFLLRFHPEIGAIVGLGAVLVLGLFFAMVGAWISGMIAISIPNTALKRFQAAIDRGEILLMVDVPVRRVSEIRQLIELHHPEAQSKGIEAHIPAFP
jgi:hypothetical protein